MLITKYSFDNRSTLTYSVLKPASIQSFRHPDTSFACLSRSILPDIHVSYLCWLLAETHSLRLHIVLYVKTMIFVGEKSLFFRFVRGITVVGLLDRFSALWAKKQRELTGRVATHTQQPVLTRAEGKCSCSVFADYAFSFCHVFD